MPAPSPEAASPPDPPLRGTTRALAYAAVAAAFACLYARSLAWGWLGLDDWRFIISNPHLGHGWDSVRWALTDVEFGRRWTPGVWLVACVCGTPTALKFHILVFALGLLLSLLVTEICLQHLRRAWALPAALLFVASPLRIEVFTWGMGFVYETVALLLCAAWLLRRRTGWSALCVGLALATYPQAAGAAAGFCLLNWRRPAGWAIGASIVLLALVQYRLRMEYGVIQWHQRFDYLPLILPHYALNLVFPFATVPVFPSLYYPLMIVGGVLIVAAAAYRPVAVLWWVLLFAPTLAASVTEGFWFGARYCLIPSIAAYVWIGHELSRLRSRLALPLAWALVAGFATLNCLDNGMSRGVGLLAREAKQEAALVGIDFDLLRTIQDQSPKGTDAQHGVGP